MTLHNDSEEPATFRQRQARLRLLGVNGNGAGVPLAVAAREAQMAWASPTASDGRGGRTKGTPSHGQPKILAVDALRWATPRVAVTGGRAKKTPTHGWDLPAQAHAMHEGDFWPTPTKGDYQRGQQPMYRGTENPSLGSRATERTSARWARPTCRDWKDGAGPSEEAPTNGLLGRQAPRTPMPGPSSSHTGPISPPPSPSPLRLNPAFVEWLMNWPEGWSDFAPLAPSAYKSWETAWSQRLRPSPS